jgi:hypothetical protein
MIRRLEPVWVSALLSTVSRKVGDSSMRSTFLICLVLGLGGLIGNHLSFLESGSVDETTHQALPSQAYCLLPISYGGGQLSTQGYA